MNNIIVQTTVDPYYVDMESDNYHGSGAEPYANAVNKAVLEGDIERLRMLQEEAIKWYKSMGYDAKIIEGRVFQEIWILVKPDPGDCQEIPGRKNTGALRCRNPEGDCRVCPAYSGNPPNLDACCHQGSGVFRC